MLTGWDVECRAFWDELATCRKCMIERYGLGTVQRLERGLKVGLPDVDRMTRYECDERAVDAGYKCDLSEHAAERESEERGGYCPECGVLQCMDCGARLDTTPAEGYVQGLLEDARLATASSTKQEPGDV